MVMLSAQRITEIVGERVVLAWERTPGYHNDLAAALLNIVRVQDEGFSDRGRRHQVKRIIEELGEQVLTQQQENE